MTTHIIFTDTEADKVKIYDVTARVEVFGRDEIDSAHVYGDEYPEFV